MNATVFTNHAEADQYGNHGMITQDVSKEEKDSGVKGAILGNTKVFWTSEAHQHSSQPQQSAPASGGDDGFSDIPFVCVDGRYV